MLRVLWNGRSGLQANQNRIDAISNNIANVETNGYKSEDVSFQDVFYDKLDKMNFPDTSNGKNINMTGSGAKADVTVRDMSEGSLVSTGREEDLAIAGPGYFRLKDENGKVYYTRDSSFSFDAKGNLVNNSGKILDIDNYVPGSAKRPIKVADNGNVFSADGKQVGKITLYDFKDKDDLISVGENLFVENGETPSTVNTTIKQGYSEKSNVDMTKELTDMIVTQRAYSLNAKSIKQADDMWQIANNLRGR